MSTRALHALTVRMLGDAAFRAAVYADPDRALADEPISPEERRWFVAVDRRAWDIDPLRNARLLTALLDEYRITAIALAQAGWKLRQLHDFFASPACHRAITAWESLFMALPDYLRSKLHARREAASLAMLAIEEAIAKVRRAAFDTRPLPPPNHLRLAPTAAVALVPGGALALWEAQHQALLRAGHAAPAIVAHLLGDSRRPPGTPRLPPFSTRGLTLDAPEGLLVVAPPGAEPAIATVGEGLVAWLKAATDAIPYEAFLTHAIDAGLERHEAIEIMEELLGEGTLLSGG